MRTTLDLMLIGEEASELYLIVIFISNIVMQKISFKSISLAIIGALVMAPLLPVVANAATPSVAPTVTITSPANGATVSGTTNVTANPIALFSNCVITLFGQKFDVSSLQSSHSGGNVFVCGTDQTTLYQGQHGTNLSRMAPYAIPTNYGITEVQFYVDGTLVFTDTTSPYSFSWNTTGASNGAHTLIAKASDGTSTGTSPQINVTVNNSSTPPSTDNVPPTVSITNPSNGATLTGTATVSANASDNVGVTKVEFYANGTLISTQTTPVSSTYSFGWETTKVQDGQYTITAKAYDAAGNSTTSSGVTTIVTNNQQPPTVNHDDDGDENEYEFEHETEHESHQYHEHQHEHQQHHFENHSDNENDD